MDNERKGSPSIAWCSRIIVLLLGLYVGAYAFTVDAQEVVESNSTAGGFILAMEPPYRLVPNGFAESFFAPIHAIDRKLRREKWEPPVLRGHP